MICIFNTSIAVNLCALCICSHHFFWAKKTEVWILSALLSSSPALQDLEQIATPKLLSFLHCHIPQLWKEIDNNKSQWALDPTPVEAIEWAQACCEKVDMQSSPNMCKSCEVPYVIIQDHVVKKSSCLLFFPENTKCCERIIKKFTTVESNSLWVFGRVWGFGSVMHVVYEDAQVYPEFIVVLFEDPPPTGCRQTQAWCTWFTRTRRYTRISWSPYLPTHTRTRTITWNVCVPTSWWTSALSGIAAIAATAR